MDPIPVTATATVMVALTPRGKPRPVVVDAETATRLVRAFADALAACVAGQKMLDDLAAVDAMEARDDTWVKAAPDDADDVVDATIYCGVRYFDGEAWQDCDQPAGHDGLHGDPALRGDGGELPAPASLTPKACSIRTVHLPHAHWEGGAAVACDGRGGLPAHKPDDADVLLAVAELDREMREGDSATPERCGSRPYPAGSEGDDGTECILPKGHPGEHDDGVTVTAPPSGWRDPATGLVSGPIYDHLNRLSCGCTFHGPLTWPAGRKAHCDKHGAVKTVAAPGEASVTALGDRRGFVTASSPVLRGARIGWGNVDATGGEWGPVVPAGGAS